MRIYIKKGFQFLAISSVLLVSACGGGGSASSTATPTPVAAAVITTGNQVSVAAQGYSGLNNLSGQILSTNLVTGVNVTTPGTGLFDAILALTYQGLATGTQKGLTGVTTSQTVNCAGGGSLQISANTLSSTGISNGDSLSVTAFNCSENNMLMNGGLSVVFNSLVGTPGASGSWSATLATVFTNFSVQTGIGTNHPVINGDMSLGVKQTSANVVSFSVSGNKLNVTNGANSMNLSAYSYTGSENGSTLNFSANFSQTVTTAALGTVSFTVVTTTPFTETVGSNPSAGSFTVTAADKTSIKVTVIDINNVQIQLDPTGSGTYTSTTTVPWTSLKG